MKTIILFFENTGVNYSVIWSDISIYVCLFLLLALIFGYYFAQSTNKGLRECYLVSSTVKLCAAESRIIDLESENKDLLTRVQKSERKRDKKGHYLPTSGKGHGKKKITA